MKKIKFTRSPHLEVVARRLAMEVLDERAREICTGYYDSLKCERKTYLGKTLDGITKSANQFIKDNPPLLKRKFRSNPAKFIKRFNIWDKNPLERCLTNNWKKRTMLVQSRWDESDEEVFDEYEFNHPGLYDDVPDEAKAIEWIPYRRVAWEDIPEDQPMKQL